MVEDKILNFTFRVSLIFLLAHCVFSLGKPDGISDGNVDVQFILDSLVLYQLTF